MIYIDVSHLRQFFENGWNVSGIQRVTYECVVGFKLAFGDKVRLFRCDENSGTYHYAPADLIKELSEARGDILKQKALQDSGPLMWRELESSALKGQSLLLSEGQGNFKRYETFKSLRDKENTRIILIIYDLIPLVCPDYCTLGTVLDYQKIIPIALDLADEVVTISEFTKQDLLKVCGHMLRVGTPIHVWPLAHEFPTLKDANTVLPEIVRSNFVFLAGTIEDRKNQHLVAAAWQKLAKKHGKALPQLVMAGKFGKITWSHLKLRWLLYRQSWGKKNIIALNGCRDKIFRALYDNCLFSVYVSTYEGWGLPIGEGLWCGRPVLSGTATSLPEVGGKLCDYVDPHDQDALIASLEKLCFDHAYRESRAQQVAAAKLQSWADVSKNLARLIAPIQS